MPHRVTLLVAIACLSACSTPSTFEYDESDLVPGTTILDQLAHLSQLDRLEDTDADFARCSAASALNAYLLLGGDFAKAARQFGVAPEFTFENAHRLQEALYDHADRNGKPGVLGSADPEYDTRGNLTGWRLDPADEFHRILEALGLSMDRVYAPTKADLLDRRAAILDWLARPQRVAFIAGVNEDMEREQFQPMDEFGNHYVTIFRWDDAFYALDSFRTPGRYALLELTPQQVEDNLMYTRNALHAVTLDT